MNCDGVGGKLLHPDLDSEVPKTIPADNVHPLRLADETPAPQRVALSWVDQLALEQLVAGDASGVIELAQGLAEALAGPSHDAVRLRTLSRAIAVARNQQALLEGMLMQRLAKRDVDGVELINKVLGGIVARLVKMTEAHRLEGDQQRRVAVTVTHADQVNVEGFR